MAEGMLVNPTQRLAVKGSCVEQCEGKLDFFWALLPHDEFGDRLGYVRNKLTYFFPN